MSQLRAARWSLAIFSATFLLLPSTQATAQASSTASRSADISVFGGYADAAPDYGPYRNHGITAGVDYTRYFHFPVTPSLELRTNVVSGKTVTEHTYLFGLRAQTNLFRHYHPYADFLIGPGNIHFNFYNNGYLGDNSIVPSYGGGVDIDLVRHFQARIDFQGQHWKTGRNVTLTPSILSIGVVYHIPFRPYIRQRDFYH